MITVDLGPLEKLMAAAERVGELGCEYAAEDVLGRLREREPVETGALVESLAIRTGTLPGYGFAVIGPETDRTGYDDRATPPARYQASVNRDLGDFMATVLGPGDLDALAEGTLRGIRTVLDDAAAPG